MRGKTPSKVTIKEESEVFGMDDRTETGTETGTVFQFQYQLGTVFRYRNCRYGLFFNVSSKWSYLIKLNY